MFLQLCKDKVIKSICTYINVLKVWPKLCHSRVIWVILMQLDFAKLQSDY